MCIRNEVTKFSIFLQSLQHRCFLSLFWMFLQMVFPIFTELFSSMPSEQSKKCLNSFAQTLMRTLYVKLVLRSVTMLSVVHTKTRAEVPTSYELIFWNLMAAVSQIVYLFPPCWPKELIYSAFPFAFRNGMLFSCATKFSFPLCSFWSNSW